jgi:hypothetical protein
MVNGRYALASVAFAGKPGVKRWDIRIVLAGLIASFALIPTAYAQDPAYFITFEVHGAQFTSPAGINDQGEVAGWWSKSSYFSDPQGFVRDRCGTITSFAVPGAVATYVQFPQTINQAGDVAGNWYGPGVGLGAFVRSSGKLIAGVLPGAVTTDVTSINDLDEVLGSYNDANGTGGQFVAGPWGFRQTFEVPGATTVLTQAINNEGVSIGSWAEGVNSTAFHGFIRYSNGEIVSFDVPTAAATYTSSINNKGEIVGVWNDASGNGHGFLRHVDGSFTSFEVPNALSTNATSINGRGEITGTWSSGSVASHSFVRDKDGNITAFDAPGAVLTIAAAINAEGEITGEYYDDANVLHGFIRIHPHDHDEPRDGCPAH